MTLFKNKKREKPALLYILEEKLREAREKKETSFYYPLWDHEVLLATSWAVSHHIMALTPFSFIIPHRHKKVKSDLILLKPPCFSNL